MGPSLQRGAGRAQRPPFGSPRADGPAQPRPSRRQKRGRRNACRSLVALDRGPPLRQGVANPVAPDWSPTLLGRENPAAEGIVPATALARRDELQHGPGDVTGPAKLHRGGQRITCFVAGDDECNRRVAAWSRCSRSTGGDVAAPRSATAACSTGRSGWPAPGSMADPAQAPWAVADDRPTPSRMNRERIEQLAHSRALREASLRRPPRPLCHPMLAVGRRPDTWDPEVARGQRGVLARRSGAERLGARQAQSEAPAPPGSRPSIPARCHARL